VARQSSSSWALGSSGTAQPRAHLHVFSGKPQRPKRPSSPPGLASISSFWVAVQPAGKVNLAGAAACSLVGDDDDAGGGETPESVAAAPTGLLHMVLIDSPSQDIDGVCSAAATRRVYRPGPQQVLAVGVVAALHNAAPTSSFGPQVMAQHRPPNTCYTTAPNCIGSAAATSASNQESA
jgi:hypothetical protein